jgi:hypothetical protein
MLALATEYICIHKLNISITCIYSYYILPVCIQKPHIHKLYDNRIVFQFFITWKIKIYLQITLNVA